MTMFIITAKRLVDMAKTSILNWFVKRDSPNTNILIVVLIKDGVKYIYRTAFKNNEELPIEITSLLSDSTEILGFSEPETIEEMQYDEEQKQLTPEERSNILTFKFI